MNRLLVISHKETYSSGGEFFCTGGFALQIGGIGRLFTETIVMTTLRKGPPPPGAQRLDAPGIEVSALPEPGGSGFLRKLGLLIWVPRHWARVVRQMVRSDLVHCLVPGDIGVLGVLTALLLRKPLWVRHCGTWGSRTTMADRFLVFLLPRIAGRRALVQATGGGDAPPDPGREGLYWIFSTSISSAEMETIRRRRVWQGGVDPILLCVGRLSAGKNVAAALRTLALLSEDFSGARLEIVGSGPEEESLLLEARSLGLAGQTLFHGNVAHSEVLRICSEAHLMLFPTRVAEGFPKAVVEALACGLPVVATAVSVLPALIGQDCGRLVAEPTPEALAAATRDLLSSPRRWAECSEAARRVAVDLTLESWLAQTSEQLSRVWPDWRKAEAS